MSITIHPELETRLRARAEAEGLTVDAYLERLVSAEQNARLEVETLALEGMNSGPPRSISPDYWQEKHRQLDEQLRLEQQ